MGGVAICMGWVKQGAGSKAENGRGIARNDIELTTEEFRKDKVMVVVCLKAMVGSNGMRQK